ncbi:DUF6716 putative glycosyltransferase [Angustibacter aerolatus]
MSPARPPRVVAVADSDSYLKWAVGLLGTLPADWRRRAVVVRSPIAPSAAQRAAAGREDDELVTSVRERSLPKLLRDLRREQPDVVILACTGPVVDVLSHELQGPDRPVLVSGLPGLCVPASRKAWRFRARADVFVAPSRHERVLFEEARDEVGATGTVALAALPFLRVPAPAEGGLRDRVVFAAQAKVPREPEDREAILLALDELARRRPDLRPVVKLRALAGEQQTHRERHPYDELWAGLVARGRVVDGSVGFATGSMAAHLELAAGLVTVSSTAALEAMGAGVPVLVLDDWGVDERMLNLAFEGSRCFGSLDDLREGRFHHPSPEWLRDNYFHDPSDDDLVPVLKDLVHQARTVGLPTRGPVVGGTGPRRRRRNRWRLMVPPKAQPVLRPLARVLLTRLF